MYVCMYVCMYKYQMFIEGQTNRLGDTSFTAFFQVGETHKGATINKQGGRGFFEKEIPGPGWCKKLVPIPL